MNIAQNTKLVEVNKKLGLSDDLTKEKNRNIIFIFCPPKVGSTTLVTSLRLSCSHKITILHIHDEEMLAVLCNIKNITINEIINYNKALGKNITVIDIYRTPIEHKISTFFENISFHFNNKEEIINNYNLNAIIQRFNKIYPFLCNTDYYRQVYKLPIIHNFDFEKKYTCQYVNGIKYIKIRLKDSLYWSKILLELLGLNVHIIKDYESSSKPYSTLFKSFKKEYRLPNNYFQELDNVNLDFYLSVEEKKNYLREWSNKLTLNFTPFSKEEYQFYYLISRENQYYINIQQRHYIDEGCCCRVCSQKRFILLNRIKNGYKDVKKNDYIIHSNVINENNFKKQIFLKKYPKHNFLIGNI
jgi:hypothetical protein